ncbi:MULTISPECIES: class F sortase [unclassified Nocardioides]|uniref:class F sortase n=1 Tax=unclassified Nocardioides TaxID=2615069 RepID=UPI001150109C|nr:MULTISPECIES: class F sortase [unclassified Nocardioides]WGY04516.1 class F sortase [Nocardioides sp. QY071]
MPRARRTAAALALVGLVLAAAGMSVARPWRDEPDTAVPPHRSGARPAEASPPPAAPASPVRGRPIRVEIPAIDVSARIQPVAVAGDVLTPPDDVRVVGWWEGGAEPGDQRGAVLMTGHTYSRGDGVFDRLAQLVPGDRVRVVTDHGVVRYRVEAVAAYPRDRIAELAPQLFSATGGPRLVLTTCSGYDGEHYRTTTVVRAAPAG